MTFQQELASWRTPSALPLSPVPEIGSKAPSSPSLQFPNPIGKPTIITFLRHCGCPFAEKTFKELRNLAGKHPEVNCIAVSHSDQKSTDKWVIAIGGEWDVQIIVNPERDLYAQWGLGASSAWHVLSPWSLYGVYTLGKREGIWNLPTESGTRWQTAGSFAVDRAGVVRWVKVVKSAAEIPDFAEALETVAAEV